MLWGLLSVMVLPAVSAFDRGIAVCWLTFKLGTACANGELGSKSGLVMLRYRDQKLVSIVSWVRLVSRPICRAPSALLLGNVAKPCLLRSIPLKPLETR